MINLLIGIITYLIATDYKKKEDKYNYVSLISFLIFNLWWYALKIDQTLEPIQSLGLYCAIVFMFIYTTCKSDDECSPEAAKDKLKETNQEEMSLASIVLSISLFASRMEKNNKSFKIFFRLLLYSFLILVPSLILGRRETENDDIILVERIKFGAVINSVSMIVIAILVIINSI